MQVVQVDPFDAEPLEAALDMPPQRLGPAVAVDALGRQIVDDQPAFRRHDDAVPPARDGPADEPFVVPVAVEGGGVEQADAGVERLADDPD